MNLEQSIAASKLITRGTGENLEAMSPPGFGGTTKKMKKDHPGITNPYALAWSQYEKGDKSHVKAPKGSGAKHVSEEVKKKRSKALKKKKVEAGGPGSGRKPGNGLDKTHQWTVSKATGEHLLKSKGGPVGYSAGTYARVAENWPNPPKDKAFSAKTFGKAGSTTFHSTLEEAKDAAEKRVASKKS